MKHCSTHDYNPRDPGHVTRRAKHVYPDVVLWDAFMRHLDALSGVDWVAYDSEFSTTYRTSTFGRGMPNIVVVTRCRRGHLHTVIHLSNEPYPRP